MAQIFELTRNGLEPVKERDLQIGQIIWLNGYGQSKYCHERKAIYEKQLSDYDDRLQYKVVNLDKPSLSIKNAYEIKSDTEIFGIGTYYTEGDFAVQAEIDEAIKKAKKQEELDKIANEKAKKLREEIEEKGKKIFEENKPENAKSVIIAEYEKNETDLMTDYFGSSTQRTIILAFSNHDRNLFSEMRKACLNCDIPEIKELAKAPKKYENRQNWSMGAGYFLGENRYSGWKIRKTYLGDNSHYYTAGLENGFYAWKENKEEKKENEKKVIDNDTNVTYNKYKGHDIINLPCNGKGFSFGKAKAKAILDNLEAIKEFANS